MSRVNRDRAMCVDGNCPSRNACLRFMATPAQHQVAAEMGRTPGAERCQSFTPLEEAGE